MAKLHLDIDETLIGHARLVLGTASIEETIHIALREVLRSDARRQEVKVLADMDGLDLSDEKTMVKAWRS